MFHNLYIHLTNFKIQRDKNYLTYLVPSAETPALLQPAVRMLSARWWTIARCAAARRGTLASPHSAGRSAAAGGTAPGSSPVSGDMVIFHLFILRQTNPLLLPYCLLFMFMSEEPCLVPSARTPAPPPPAGRTPSAGWPATRPCASASRASWAPRPAADSAPRTPIVPTTRPVSGMGNLRNL